jgi:hypothetical protein
MAITVSECAKNLTRMWKKKAVSDCFGQSVLVRPRREMQVGYLFLLAEDAFGRGKTQLGEQLTAPAVRYLDEANALETAFTQPPPESQRPVIQQQQAA